MTLITLKIDNTKTEQLVYQFAQKLKIEYYKSDTNEPSQKKESAFFDVLDNLVSQIKTTSFGDPIKLQKSQLKNRKLPNRK